MKREKVYISGSTDCFGRKVNRVGWIINIRRKSIRNKIG